MSHTPFRDQRALRLLSRVGDDLGNLRHDIATLISHTTRHTFPDGAKDLAASARNQLSAGGSYAVSRLRSIKSSPPPKEAIGIGIGVLALGLIAFGTYSLLKNSCDQARRLEAEDEDLAV